MKRILIFIIMILSLSIGYSQPRGGSPQRSSAPSTSVRATPSTSRSSVSQPSRTYTQPQRTQPSATTRPSTTTSRPSTTVRPSTTTVRPSATTTSRPSTTVTTRPSTTTTVTRQQPSSRTETKPVQATPHNNGSDMVRQKPAGTVTGPRQDVQKTPQGDVKGHGDPHHGTPGHGTPHNGHPTPPPPPPPHHHGDMYPHHHGYVGYHPYHHHIYHPYWHRNIYLHRIYWNPWCPVVYIDGFWIYTHTYYFTDYNVRTVYVRDYNNVEIIDYVVDDYYTYCIQQVGFDRYFRVYDGNNRLIAQQTINRRYEKLIYDEVSNGVWCIDNKNKENLFFIVDGNGQLICYKE